MILIWVYNRMQPLTNQDLPAMAAVLCNRQTIFRRQTIFPKLDTGSHEALTALTVAPIRRRKWRSGIYIFILKIFTKKMDYLDPNRYKQIQVDNLKSW